MTIDEAERALEKVEWEIVFARRALILTELVCAILGYYCVVRFGWPWGYLHAAFVVLIEFFLLDISFGKNGEHWRKLEKAKKEPAEENLKCAYREFYKKCKDTGVNPDSDLDLLAIGSVEDVKDVELLRSRYKRGAELCALKPQEDKAKEEAAEASRREVEKVNFSFSCSSEAKIARLSGKDKYLVPLRDKLEAAKKAEKEGHEEWHAFIPAPPKKRSVMAGALVADAIAGPTAGIVKAKQIADENQRDQARYEQGMPEWIQNGRHKAYQKWEQSKADVKRTKEAISKIESTMVVEDSHIRQELYSKIELTDWSFSCSDLMLTAKATANVADDATILGKEARIDGSIEVGIQDEQTGETIGCLFFNAPGYGAEKLDSVGFAKGSTELVGHCLLKHSADKIGHTERPVNLWLVEI